MAQSKSNLKADKNAPVERPSRKDDFLLLRKALIIFVASLLSGAALIGAGRFILSRHGVTQAQEQRSDALNKRRQAEKDKQDIQTYQPKFLALRERGFVGEEKRLDWIEHIKHIKENRKLLQITYEISAQQIFQVPTEMLIGDMELHGSKMKLQMDLLHEGDLLNFLNDLRQKGFYTVQECMARRIGKAQGNAQSPRLTAECTLYWLTLDERTDSRDKTPNPADQ